MGMPTHQQLACLPQGSFVAGAVRLIWILIEVPASVQSGLVPSCHRFPSIYCLFHSQFFSLFTVLLSCKFCTIGVGLKLKLCSLYCFEKRFLIVPITHKCSVVFQTCSHWNSSKESTLNMGLEIMVFFRVIPATGLWMENKFSARARKRARSYYKECLFASSERGWSVRQKKARLHTASANHSP